MIKVSKPPAVGIPAAVEREESVVTGLSFDAIARSESSDSGENVGSLGGAMKVLAGDLVEAIKPIGKQRKNKPCPVILSFDAINSRASIEEAAFGKFHLDFNGNGHTSFSAQVEGFALQRLAMGLAPKRELEFIATPDSITVQQGSFRAILPRYDIGGVGGVLQKPERPDRRHKGKVDAVPEGRYLRPRGHTWDFSLQVPFPPDDPGDPDGGSGR